MSNNNSIFEFADTFGLSSPFGNWLPPEKRRFIQNFNCNFNTLLAFIKSNRDGGINANFRYKDYEGAVKATRYTRFGSIQETSKKTIPFKCRKETENAKERELKLTVLVNQWEGRINFRELPRFRFSFDQSTEKIKFSLLFQYEQYANETDEEKFAIILSAETYTDFSDVLSYLKLELTEYSKSLAIKEFSTAFKSAETKGNANRIDWLYQQAPDFVLSAVKSDIALYADLVLLSNNSIDDDDTNENIAILNLLRAFRDKIWFTNQVNKNPNPLRKVLDKFDGDYFPDLLLLLLKIGLAAWDKNDIKKNENVYYLFGVTELDFDDDGSTDLITAGFSVYLKEKNLFKIGYMANLFEKGSIAASDSHENVLAEVSAYSPLRTTIDDNEVFLPAVVAEYFTNQEIDKARKLAINNALFFLLPEFTLIKLKTFTSIINASKNLAIKGVDELAAFLRNITGEFKAIDLEKYGIKVLFRGTTRSSTGELFLGNANTIANGVSTSTDPIRATIFAIESATEYGQKGILQIAIPKDLKKLLLLPANDRVAKELEVILKTGANEFSKMTKLEISVDDARKIINELYDVQLPSKISQRGAFNNPNLLFAEIPRLTLEQSFEFYKQVLKLK
jgi:hypothetical protein